MSLVTSPPGAVVFFPPPSRPQASLRASPSQPFQTPERCGGKMSSPRIKPAPPILVLAGSGLRRAWPYPGRLPPAAGGNRFQAYRTVSCPEGGAGRPADSRGGRPGRELPDRLRGGLPVPALSPAFDLPNTRLRPSAASACPSSPAVSRSGDSRRPALSCGSELAGEATAGWRSAVRGTPRRHGSFRALGVLTVRFPHLPRGHAGGARPRAPASGLVRHAPETSAIIMSRADGAPGAATAMRRPSAVGRATAAVAPPAQAPGRHAPAGEAGPAVLGAVREPFPEMPAYPVASGLRCRRIRSGGRREGGPARG